MIRNALFLFVVLAAVFVVYLPSYLQMQDLRRRNEVFEKRIIQLEAENISFAEERDKLKNDPEYFEKIARERMGLIKDGEVIYKVLPPGVKKSAPVEEVKPKAAAAVKKSATAKKTAVKTPAKTTVKAAAKTTAKTASKATTTIKATTTTKAKPVVATDKKKQAVKD